MLEHTNHKHTHHAKLRNPLYQNIVSILLIPFIILNVGACSSSISSPADVSIDKYVLAISLYPTMQELDAKDSYVLLLAEDGTYQKVSVGPVFSHMTLWGDDGLYVPGFDKNLYFSRGSSSAIASSSMHDNKHEYVLSHVLFNYKGNPLYIEDLGFSATQHNSIVMEDPVLHHSRQYEGEVPYIVSSCPSGLYGIWENTAYQENDDGEVISRLYDYVNFQKSEVDVQISKKRFTTTDDPKYLSIEGNSNGVPCVNNVITFLESDRLDYHITLRIVKWDTQGKTLEYTNVKDVHGNSMNEQSEMRVFYDNKSLRGDTFTYFNPTIGIIHQIDTTTGNEQRRVEVGNSDCIHNSKCGTYLFGQNNERIIIITYGMNLGTKAKIHIYDAETLKKIKEVPVSMKLARELSGGSDVGPTSQISVDPQFR
ncbi:hypothetical protein EJ419_07665 [Alloscardovia theropitheci]|uniref:Uncharacterized protein n=1 Tax=Alloscardovia theropitheci TaxID=2496842 RepID=A0A4R0QNR3_9BIFI|nr:hypothetical protein [Alloscardovia theropitheci]TCD53833.1 hypothetical protein EJ419_07665 [Alloscardovia theropitheci]